MEAVRLAPDNPLPLAFRAAMRADLNRCVEAKADVERALTLPGASTNSDVSAMIARVAGRCR